MQSYSIHRMRINIRLCPLVWRKRDYPLIDNHESITHRDFDHIGAIQQIVIRIQKVQIKVHVEEVPLLVGEKEGIQARKR